MWILFTAACAAALLAQESVRVVAPTVVPEREPPLVDMSKRVLALTGPEPVNCGGYALRRVNDSWQGATSDELWSALRCAERAIEDNRAFWTYSEYPGTDSWIARGLLRTASGELRWFLYDGSPCGGPGCEPQLSVESCARPFVQQAAAGHGPEFRCRER